MNEQSKDALGPPVEELMAYYLDDEARAELRRWWEADEATWKTLKKVLSIHYHAALRYARAKRPSVAHPRTVNRDMRSLRFAEWVLTLVSHLAPKRICDEEIGDTVEQIRADLAADRSRFWIYLSVLRCSFWVLINAIRELSASFQGKRSKQ